MKYIRLAAWVEGLLIHTFPSAVSGFDNGTVVLDRRARDRYGRITVKLLNRLYVLDRTQGIGEIGYDDWFKYWRLE